MTANERAFQEKWLETNSGRTLLEFWVNEKEMIAKSAKMSDLPAPAFSFPPVDRISYHPNYKRANFRPPVSVLAFCLPLDLRAFDPGINIVFLTPIHDELLAFNNMWSDKTLQKTVKTQTSAHLVFFIPYFSSGFFTLACVFFTLGNMWSDKTLQKTMKS